VAFVVPHLGSFADDWRAQRAFLDVLERHANVHTDTSGVRRFDLLVEAVRRGGPRKVLFGSDGPWLHPGVELAKVRAIGLPEHHERLVLGANLLRLVSRVRRPSGVRPVPAAGTGELPAGTDPWIPDSGGDLLHRRKV
jgi:predicted TIM-barrel fold metal-dependent hydrolase